MSGRFIMISGCSGGGKSTLLAELARRGYATVEEPGRRIVARERERGGSALPWIDLRAFAECAVALSLEDLETASHRRGPVFFDRGLIDAIAALETAGGPAMMPTAADYPFYGTVFLAPPWRAIFAADEDRRHSFEDAVREFERLERVYRSLGYNLETIPKMPVPLRADFVIERLGLVATGGRHKGSRGHGGN